MSEYHIPVMLAEGVEALNIKPDGVYFDGTAGGGGHSTEILKRLENGLLISCDRDPEAIAEVTKRLGESPRNKIVRDEYCNIGGVLDSLGIDRIDGVLLDIGVSSHQLDCAQRGFSYHMDAPLDMRMSSAGETAAQMIARMEWKELARIFSRYGEEKFSVPIAKAICRQRETAPIETTEQLAELIKSAVPAAVRRDGHPARKVFQALRIAVNDELGQLERGLAASFDRLKPGGRLAVITFHSLEDRIVKQTMAEWCVGCTCPPSFPVCVCGKKPSAALINKKPIEPSEKELASNPRSRSAKLRVCERL